MTVSHRPRLREIIKFKYVERGDQSVFGSKVVRLRPLVPFREWVGLSNEAKLLLINMRA